MPLADDLRKTAIEAAEKLLAAARDKADALVTKMHETCVREARRAAEAGRRCQTIGMPRPYVADNLVDEDDMIKELVARLRTDGFTVNYDLIMKTVYEDECMLAITLRW